MDWRKNGSHATVGEVLDLFAEPEGKQWRAAVESRSGLGLWINAPYATQKDAQRAAEEEALRLLQEAMDEITGEDDAQRRGEAMFNDRD